MKTGNGSKFFQLYQTAPHMSGYLIDYMLHPMRNTLYDAVIKSYETVSLSFMMKKLNFVDAKECKEFLDSRRALYVDPSSVTVATPGASGSGRGGSCSTGSSLTSARKPKKIKAKKKEPEVSSVPLEEYVLNCRASRAS